MIESVLVFFLFFPSSSLYHRIRIRILLKNKTHYTTINHKITCDHYWNTNTFEEDDDDDNDDDDSDDDDGASFLIW